MRSGGRVVRRARSTGRAAAALLGLGLVVGLTAPAAATGATPFTPDASATAAWERDRSRGTSLPAPDAEPAEVAAFFAGVDPAEAARLAAAHPAVLGQLDGAPAAVRYAANRHRSNRSTVVSGPEEAAVRREQLLLFDDRGRGRVAVVLGDLDQASAIAVLVPGSDVDLARFAESEQPLRRPMGMAEALRDELADRSADDETAVIAWLGYQTPEGIGVDALGGRLARAGAHELVDFTEGLRATHPGRHVSVICHSYGAVVCGTAAPALAADELVFLAAPGVRADSVAELGTEARVWAGRGDHDWISAVPALRLGDLGHGGDPMSAGFGARRVPTRDVTGHDGYFVPGTDSLAAMAEIVTAEIVPGRAEEQRRSVPASADTDTDDRSRGADDAETQHTGRAAATPTAARR